MSVLTVVQRAAVKCGFDTPTSLSSSERTIIAIGEVLNDAGRVIRDEYDWSVLKTLHTITGTGALEDFALPEDYARMVKSAHIWPSNMPNWPLDHCTDEDEWLQLNAQDFTTVNGRWTLYGGQMHIKPAPVDGVTLQYFYITSGIFLNGTTPGPTYTDGNDTFVLDENLLRLAFIYKWKQANGQTYVAELDDYEDARETAIGADKGPRIFAVGTSRTRYDARVAYPGSIVP